MNFKEKFQNVVKKTAEFVEKRPILTTVIISGAFATVASIVAYKIGYEKSTGDHKHVFNLRLGNHHVHADMTAFCNVDHYTEACENICRGAERMGLENGEAVFVMKTGSNTYESCAIFSNPDCAILTLEDIASDLELDDTYDEF